MAPKTTRFQVDSKLVRLLSQEYPSKEKALTEPVDNTWDADFENVQISLTAPMNSPQASTGKGLSRDEHRAAMLRQVQHVLA